MILALFFLMAESRAYHIGTPGKTWGAAERAQWLSERKVARSYKELVRTRIEALEDRFDVEAYGALSANPERYPLLCVRTRGWSAEKPSVLVTGGVHGYETSGVLGALAFLEDHAEAYADRCNLLVAPCVSPWAFETVQRWNAAAIDPNRSFQPSDSADDAGSPASAVDDGGSWRGARSSTLAEESIALSALVRGVSASAGAGAWLCHIDLHETTDSDETEFLPARAASQGEVHERGAVPDGFYVVGDSCSPLAPVERETFLRTVVDAARRVTHIAPADVDGRIIGERISQPGVIHYPYKQLGLCAGVTRAVGARGVDVGVAEGTRPVEGAPYAATTEVYPDSPAATAEQCTRAQVACVTAAIEYVLGKVGQ